MCKNSSIMDLDRFSISSSDNAGLSVVGPGIASSFTDTQETGYVITNNTHAFNWGYSKTYKFGSVYGCVIFVNVWGYMCEGIKFVWVQISSSPDSLDWLRSSLLLLAVLDCSLGVSRTCVSLWTSSCICSSAASFADPPKDGGPDRVGPKVSGLSLRSRPELPQLGDTNQTHILITIKIDGQFLLGLYSLH